MILRKSIIQLNVVESRYSQKTLVSCGLYSSTRINVHLFVLRSCEMQGIKCLVSLSRVHSTDPKPDARLTVPVSSGSIILC